MKTLNIFNYAYFQCQLTHHISLIMWQGNNKSQEMGIYTKQTFMKMRSTKAIKPLVEKNYYME